MFYPTCRAACEALRLLGDDREWDIAIQEACVSATSVELRSIFAYILTHCDVIDLAKVWTKQDSVPKLNSEHRKIYDLIIDADAKHQQELIFVYGHGGTAPMNDHRCFKALDRSLRDIFTAPHSLFGVFTLKENMRLARPNINTDERNLVNLFSSWLLDIGDGKIGQADEEDPENTSWIDIPPTIATCRSRIDVVTNSDGMVFENKNVATAFVLHYEAFLGQPGTTCGLNDNDLFRVILDQNVAIDMIKNVTRQEMKNALFSIGNDKAPGPDGYTAAFFKESWDIMADDFVATICDFFTNGKILKELNHTIIALILKVSSLTRVNDYRPISCCNVLFKCISKIIVNRIKDSLKVLVSPNQSAFVSGRSIADNILLTQELMHNYHLDRSLPRCAFKVDIQKAYDTVDWDFLKKILASFGFYTYMIGWIMECVTTTSFSISINGSLHGFFKGKCGLHQGDPLSPYLFTLIMEVLTLMLQRGVRNASSFTYHRYCSKLELINLCFADDLFLFAHRDVDSAKIIKDALFEFKEVSGLVPSLPKSTAYFCNVLNHTKLAILQILPFEEGRLPVKYLGVPLVSSCLVFRDCKELIEKV
ncbi:hypothetical protein Tco_0556227 [Tanacetum coccineum]